MRKKRIIIALCIFLLISIIASTMVFLKSYSTRWNKTVEIKRYGVRLKYPRGYIDNEGDEKVIDKLASSTLNNSKSESNTSFELIRRVETIIDATSVNSKINMKVEAIIKEKTKQSLDEICKNYISMYKIFNEEYVIKDSNYEIININEEQAGKIKIIFDGKESKPDAGSIVYLFPLDNREITFKFNGTEEMLTVHENEINKIINSIEFDKSFVVENQQEGEVLNLMDEIESGDKELENKKSGEETPEDKSEKLT